MTQEQIKAKAKEYFPNDEFKQQIVIDAINWATKELQKENAELKGEADSVLDNWCKGNDPCPHLKKRDEQLAKAKEIITKIMQRIPSFQAKSFQELSLLNALSEAEQFLSEVEK